MGAGFVLVPAHNLQALCRSRFSSSCIDGESVECRTEQRSALIAPLKGGDMIE